MRLLKSVAQKVRNPRLATLAESVRLDAFVRVKKAIDDMVAQLMKEKEDEIKHKDWCVDEMNTNERTTEMKNRDKDDLTAKIEDLTMTIETLTSEIETLKAEIAEMQVQLKRAGEDREKQNKEFQVTVADQRATQKLLQQALNVLKGFYDKKAKGVALAIKSEEDAQKAYEDFVKETNNSIEAKSKDITNKTEEKAKAEGDKVEAEVEKEAVM